MYVPASDQYRMIRDTARGFAEQELLPAVRERDRAASYDSEVMAKLGPMGFMGITVPEELGGAGLDTQSAAVIIEELGRVDASLTLNVCAHNGLGLGHIMLAGSEELKRRVVPDLAQGKAFAAWGLTEPGSGSDAGGMRTTAVRDGDEWIINGSKMFITLGSMAKWCVALAVTDRSQGKRGISAFLIDTSDPGYTAQPIVGKLGMRSSDTSALTFENVRVPHDRLLGKEGEGFIDTLRILDGGRISIGALGVGIARGCVEDSTRYATEREQFGQPIIQFQMLQEMLVDMATETEAARLLVERAAALRDAGQPYTREASMAKLFASEVAMRAAVKAVQVHGGYGYTDEFHVERYMRDAKLLEIGEGSSQVQRMVIARHLMRS